MINRRCRRWFALVAVPFLAAGSLSAAAGDKVALDPDTPYLGTRGNPVTYQIDLSFVITAPYKTKVLRVWLPLPQSDALQQVSNRVLSTSPSKVEPRIGTEKMFGNQFAYFAFHDPQGGQVIRHRFTIKTWEVHWDIEAKNVVRVKMWPASFDRYLANEANIRVDGEFRKLAQSIVRERSGPAEDLATIMTWIQGYLSYDHAQASLRADARHALEAKAGHCSDYHGLCAALGRSLGYPTRIVYGLNPYPKNSPSHCKLEAFLPPYGWVPFDISETQRMVQGIKKDAKLSAKRKQELTWAAAERLTEGFRDNTWFAQTRGSDYELVPPASKRVPVVRTLYAEADGVPLPDPDPANPKLREFAWMTVHHYTADREIVNPFTDWRTLERYVKASK